MTFISRYLFANCFWQSGEHFGIDMMHRKAEVKDIITEVIKNMSDDEETSESEDESGKDDDA